MGTTRKERDGASIAGRSGEVGSRATCKPVMSADRLWCQAAKDFFSTKVSRPGKISGH